MALCNFWSSVSVFLYLTTIPFASPLYFNLSPIKPVDMNTNINCTGDAYISNRGLQVTMEGSSKGTRNSSIGRATYKDPLHLWDKASGKLTDFYTHYSFLIDASESNCTNERRLKYGADGLAFFLAPLGSTAPVDSEGGGLGLAPPNATANTSENPFVAVEFDTYAHGRWDSIRGMHVGIDINSLYSNRSVPWRYNLVEGNKIEAWISYNSTSKNLSVIFTGYMGNGRLNSTVDLSKYLPELVSVGFSAATGVCFEKHNVMSWEFNSTLELVTNNRNHTDSSSMVPNISSSPSYPVNHGGKKIRVGLVIGLIVGLSVLFLVLVLIGYILWRNKNKKGRSDEISLDITMDTEFERDCGPKKFSYGELVGATDNFSDEKMLGKGGFGGVYLGFLRDSNSYIAVKRVSKDSKQGPREYASEVKIISRLRHRNLVQLLGWCHEQRELLLVYEFMPNGSLDFHLFDGKSSLKWETRYKIARGLASALLYLHEEWEQCVVHRDIKSSNVMLDSGFNAKLGDFGLARLVDHEKGSQTTVLAGTMGYMAPECVTTGKASKESDVYSFGIVSLEIACGRKPIDVKAQGKRVRMVEWVWDLYGMGNLLEAADPKLCGDYNEQEIKCLMIVGLWCAHPDNNFRPSMKEAIHVLNFEAQLPVLPSELPVATYCAPPHSVPSSDSKSSLQSVFTDPIPRT